MLGGEGGLMWVGVVDYLLWRCGMGAKFFSGLPVPNQERVPARMYLTIG